MLESTVSLEVGTDSLDLSSSYFLVAASSLTVGVPSLTFIIIHA